VPKLYATAMPRSVLAEAIRLGPQPPAGFTAVGSVAALPFGVPDEQVTTQIDGTAYLAAKAAAMRAHATQITVAGEFFALSDRVGQRILGQEYYTLLAGPSGAGGRAAGAGGEAGHERDLFAGL
jgi:N-acetyl-1-D-myo-inositol-2-amino-2-deoxy-alpha-D-glucopyranoside deacetylase